MYKKLSYHRDSDGRRSLHCSKSSIESPYVTSY